MSSHITFKTDSTFSWPSNCNQEIILGKREREVTDEESIVDIEKCDTTQKILTFQSINNTSIPRKKATFEKVEYLNDLFQETLSIQPKFQTCSSLQKICLNQPPHKIILELATLLQQTSIVHPSEGILFFQGKSGENLIARKVQITSIANDTDLTNALKLSLQIIQKIFNDKELRTYYHKGLNDRTVWHSQDHVAIRGVLHSINSVSCSINFARKHTLSKFKLLKITNVQDALYHPKKNGWLEEID